MEDPERALEKLLGALEKMQKKNNSSGAVAELRRFYSVTSNSNLPTKMLFKDADKPGVRKSYIILSISFLLSLSLYLSIYLCLSLSISLSISLYLFISISLYLSLCLSLSLSIYLSIYLSLEIYLSLSLSLSLSI